MLDDVADVASIATVAKPVPRGTGKAALAYLEASGARAISVTADVDDAAITVRLKPDAVAVFWLLGKTRWVADEVTELLSFRAFYFQKICWT